MVKPESGWQRGVRAHALHTLLLAAALLALAGCGGGDSTGGGGGDGPVPCTSGGTLGEMGAIATDATPATGSVEGSSFKHCYHFTGTSGTIYRIVLEHVETVYAYAHVSLASDTLGDLDISAYDNPSTADPATINFVAPVSGPYTLAVYGDYSLTVEENAGAPLTGFPRLTSDLAFGGAWTYGDPLGVTASHTAIPAQPNASFLSVQIWDGPGLGHKTADTTTFLADPGIFGGGGTSTAGTVYTWGDQRESAGADWYLFVQLGDFTTNRSTFYQHYFNAAGSSVWFAERQQHISPFAPGQNEYYFAPFTFGNGRLNLSAVGSGDVTCTPPQLSAQPTGLVTVNSGGTATFNHSVPVDAAASVSLYVRLEGDGFGQGAPKATQAGGPGTISFNGLTQTGAGKYYVDLELVHSTDPTCKSWYVVQDLVTEAFPPTLTTAYDYYRLALDRTTNETRFETTTYYIGTLEVLPP
jgi:hypothetical protein